MTSHSNVTSFPPANNPHPFLLLFDDGQLNKTLLARSMKHALYRLAIILRLGPENARHERLWVPVVERKPARLDLHHDPVPRQKDVVGIRQSKAVEQRLVAGNRLGALQAFAIAPAKNIRGNH